MFYWTPNGSVAGTSGGQRWLLVFMYFMVVQVATTSHQTSTLWRLNDEGIIVSGGEPQMKRASSSTGGNPNGDGGDRDQNHTPTSSSNTAHQTNNGGASGLPHEDIFDILTAPTVVGTSATGEPTWTLLSDDDDDMYANAVPMGPPHLKKHVYKAVNNVDAVLTLTTESLPKPPPPRPTSLRCGKPANFTQFDDLAGIAQRHKHPISPEPEVAYLFMKRKDAEMLQKFDVASLERRLRKVQRETPNSGQLYNQLGNYWRIKGDTAHAIECFRKALAVRPTNADVLLNMARVLFHQQYLDDAIHLATKSLEAQKSDRNAWRQYFTLGEIFRAYGHVQQSIQHLRHALELHPNHEVIARALREVESIPQAMLQTYTAWIIVCVVLSVVGVILTTGGRPLGLSNLIRYTGVEWPKRLATGEPADTATAEPKRHFNRAMAMRSLKGFARPTRSRK